MEQDGFSLAPSSLLFGPFTPMGLAPLVAQCPPFDLHYLINTVSFGIFLP